MGKLTQLGGASEVSHNTLIMRSVPWVKIQLDVSSRVTANSIMEEEETVSTAYQRASPMNHVAIVDHLSSPFFTTSDSSRQKLLKYSMVG